MKTSDEIKKGLEHCANIDDCEGCNYRDECMEKFDNTPLTKDVLAYIQRLEVSNGALRILMKKLEAKAPRWISVEDEQKPQHHKNVLCRYIFDGDSECFYAVLTYYAYGDNGYVTGAHFTGEGLYDMRVTHWMPLPEPPEEE